ncbi:MAG: hypothetical protein IT372_08425 [Polyangiaceae bacterium]|nr:hypothetical protein [Polyangiaceae bacterium]
MQQVSSPSAGARPAPLRRSLKAAVALGCLILGILGAVGACEEGEKCVGGVLRDGVCEGKCQPSLCLEGNTCVDNRCVLKCDSHLDCIVGTQDCAGVDENGAPIVEDDTGTPLMICRPNGQQAGYGSPCPFGVECGNFGACPDGTPCSAAQCNNDPLACVRDADACGSDDKCTIGKCPDGSACSVACPGECATSLTCITSGEGDADAFCSMHGCAADADCPGGFQCGITRDPHEICGTNKGNNGLCGQTTEACIEASALGAAGLMEGSVCALQNTCIKREQCAPCATDIDCSLVEGQRCVPIGGENRCARTCGVDDDCDPDYRCDTGACVPRFGACKGQGNFCEPCQNDMDCGGPETSRGCAELSGGQTACFDFSFSDTCVTDADCPTSPGGKHGECLDEEEGVSPGDDIYQRCYFPYNAVDNKFGCW